MLVLRNAQLTDGRVVDVTAAGGLVVAVDAVGGTPASGAEVVDLEGRLVLPAPAEPHAHLDKALTADIVPNPAGDLLGAIEAWVARYPERTVEEITDRARRAALRSLAAGVTALRTHVDVNEAIGLRGVDALLALRSELASQLDLQVVALVGRPLDGDDGRANRRLLAEALERGVDVGGGCPHIDVDPARHVDLALEAAAAAGRPLDLHADENLDPASGDLRRLAERIIETGFPHGAVASHCVALGMCDEAEQAEIAALVAAAGIAVVTLPQTNLFLQARGTRTAPPRGLTAVAALLDAGVTVAAGADNLQDPFNTVGRADPFETAALLVMAAHLDVGAAYDAVSNAARRAMGLPIAGPEVGAVADLLAVRAPTLRAAVADAPADRIVVRAGRVVARTMSSTTFG
jgi:cytosine deaminase